VTQCIGKACKIIPAVEKPWHNKATHQSNLQFFINIITETNHGGLNGWVNTPNDLDQIHVDGDSKSVRQPILLLTRWIYNIMIRLINQKRIHLRMVRINDSETRR
jgi:hypothetical protein